jgi:putative ATP-binding cassette transporter
MKKLKEILELMGNSKTSIIRLVFLGVVGGGASFSFITLVNYSIGKMFSDAAYETQNNLLYLFGLIIIVYFFSRRILSLGIIQLSQSVFWKIRTEVIKDAMSSSFNKLREKKSEIYSVLTNDVGNITAASLLSVDLIIAAILITACIIYMFVLSPILLLVSVIVIMIGITIYRLTSKKLSSLFLRTRELEITFLKHFNSILSGAKEINLEPKKGKDIFEKNITALANEALTNNKKAFTGYLNNEITGQLLFYMLISFLVLYAGSFFNVKSDRVVSFILVLLYVLGPIESIMGMIPTLNKASISIENISSLRKKLESDPQNGTIHESNQLDDFNKLAVKGLEYEFTDSENTFHMGPFDLTINKGEIIFIYGGNGSGKTTFLYTLIHLYQPTAGQILVDNKVVVWSESAKFKKLFAPVFSDFYLFDSFYGIDKINEQKLNEYLLLFEIDGKVSVKNGNYSTIDLSTGQRKRLALISAIMEDKKILVLDEWAADQDPHFRKKFYTIILPYLKKLGFTILAITHDDNYYRCADRLYKMDAGNLVLQQVGKTDESWMNYEKN